MSARTFLTGFAKSVLVHRHAFLTSPSQALVIGRGVRLPNSFEEAYGFPAPPDVDAAISARRWPQALRRLERWAEREPRRPEPVLLSGLIRLWSAPGTPVRANLLEGMLDRYAAEAGLRVLELAAREFPEWPPALLWLALGRLRRNELAAARRELDALIVLRRGWSWPLLIRSEVGRVDITFAEALRDLSAAERLDPENPWIHAFRSRVMFQRKPNREAEKAMDLAVALAPDSGWVRAWRGDARRKLGDLNGAEADLEAALKLEPSYDRTYLWLGKVRRAQGRPRAAEAALTRGLRFCPHFEKAFAERSRARFELGRIEGSLTDLEAAARINHRHNSLRNWTATIERMDDEKIRTLDRLARHATAAPRSARAWGWLGEALIQAGSLEQGLAALDRALKLKPRHAWARAWKGEALMRLGRLSHAEKELDEALRLDPLYGRANAFRGRVRFLRGRAAGAIRDLERAVSDSMIEYSWMYLWRAQAYAACGRLREARDDARTAAALDPSLARVARRAAAAATGAA